jgi:hypothetical protein
MDLEAIIKNLVFLSGGPVPSGATCGERLTLKRQF